MPAAALLVALGACGGGSGGGARASANCPALDSPEYTSAIDQYLHGLDPQPLRFLYYATGDSALPDAAQSALQAKGPTYLYPTDAANQKKQLDNLKSKGDAVTLLLLYTGIDTTNAGNTIGFAGRYLDKDDSGKVSPTKSILFRCRDHQWQAAPETAAPPAKSA
ncbi:MAG TPA: hypothetical protein VF118_01900 [Gemmatimonadaceae bacterium]